MVGRGYIVFACVAFATGAAALERWLGVRSLPDTQAVKADQRRMEAARGRTRLSIHRILPMIFQTQAKPDTLTSLFQVEL
jgi:hypothetical protein